MKRPPIVFPIPRSALIGLLCVFAASTAAAQAGGVSAIVPPILIGPAGEGDDGPAVQLRDQKITITLFQNAAFVHLENVMENPLDDSTDFSVRLPVSGYVIVTGEDTLAMSTGLLDVDLWNGEESAASELRETDTTTDEVLAVGLAPHAITTVEALFWVPTMEPVNTAAGGADTALIPPGDRLLNIILGEGEPDQEVANVSEASIGFSDGLSPLDSLLSFDPLPDDQTDSTVVWNWSETDDAPAERIVIRYRTLPATPSRFDSIEKISSHARCCALPDLLEPEEADDDR